MAHGGARARSGPPADPNALRRDRPNDQATWITLPSERTGPAPEWPLTAPPSPAELTHWGRVWRTAQATEWEKNDLAIEVALYVRVLAQAEEPGAAIGLIKEARMMQENLGLSYVGLLKHHWRIADAPQPDTQAATATTKTPAARSPRGPSSRDRFRVVQPVPDEAEEE